MTDDRPKTRLWRSGPVAAALWSALLPGLGQWAAGRRRRAAVLLGVGGIGLAGVAWLSTRSAVDLLAWFVQPRWLWVLLAVNVAAMVVRAFAVVDAYRLGSGVAHRQRWAARTVVGVLVIVVAAPHVLVARYGLEALDLVDALAAPAVPPLAEREQELIALGVDPDDLGPVPSTTPTPSGSFVPADPDATVDGKALIPESDRFPDRPQLEPPEANPADTPFEPFVDRFGDERITVLLAGGDGGPERWSLRTDVMIVATMNLTTGSAALFGISRDMVEAPLPDLWDEAFVDQEYDRAVRAAEKLGEEPPDRDSFESCRCFPDRLNAIWTFTNTWVRTFPEAPDPGMEALRQTLSLLLGLDIPYYVMVDMAGFVDLVDALGGVDLFISERMDVGFSPAREGEEPVRISIVVPGRYHLDGRAALAYVRNRTGSSDSVRMERQRCMLRALADELNPGTVLARFPQIVDAVESSTATNLPLSFLPDLIRAAAELDAAHILTTAIGYPYYAEELDAWGLPIVEPDRIRTRVRSVLGQLDAGGELELSATECDAP